MIPRYTRPEMARVWSDENRFKKWLDIEIASLEGWGRIGIIPAEAADEVCKNARLDIGKINQIEKVTGHDVIAFVEQVSETAGRFGRYIHYGLTSSDILDTSLALQLREAGNLLLEDIKMVAASLREKAMEFRDTAMIGRTHGIHAEPVTLGFKFAGWHCEFLRNVERMEAAVREISVGKLSGAVGTFSNVDPRVEEYVCGKFSLEREIFATQVISRDRHSFFLSVLGMVAASCEKVALQVRLLQQTEISEMAEPFGKGQKGSSAMPHKRNPILSERICGLSRIIRKNAGVSLENVPLWHERDISHSSAERIVFPESTILLDYLLHLLNRVIKGLDVSRDKLAKDMEMNGRVFFSQALLNKLVMKGLSRKEAYGMVQDKAFEAIRDNRDFPSLVKDDPVIGKHLSMEELADIFDSRRLLKHLDGMFGKIK